jgi:hypothetical protein
MQIQAPHGSLQTVPGDPTSSSDLYGHQTLTCRQRHSYTHTRILKKKEEEGEEEKEEKEKKEEEEEEKEEEKKKKEKSNNNKYW